MSIRELPSKSSLQIGTEYELFVQSIYEQLHRAENVINPEIQHDIILTGKSGAKHQIDLYWEFMIAGIRHRVAIECKDYKDPVKKEKLAAFAMVLDDIPGNVHGIYATSCGYQRGALQLAGSYGIYPMIIRKPNDKDFEGCIKDIYVYIHMYCHQNMRVNIEGDSEWILEHRPELIQDNKREIEICCMNVDTFIEDLKAGTTESILGYQNKLPGDKAGKSYQSKYDFENAYLLLNEERLKIKKIIFTYDIVEYIDTIEIHAEQVINAIVRNALTKSEQLLKNDGGVVDR